MSERDLRVALGKLLQSHGCIHQGKAEIAEEISAQFDLPLEDARFVRDVFDSSAAIELKPDDRIVEHLEQISQKLYREQPETMGAVSELIDLLKVVFCDHRFTTKRRGGAPDDEGSNELVRCCEKCGRED